MKKKALIFCESQFGKLDGKTANGLIRESEIYDIVGVIDSLLVGRDAGKVLGMEKFNIPIFGSLELALQKLPRTPRCFIYGKAPVEACIPSHERLIIVEAMKSGMDIVNGLHQIFSEDHEFLEIAKQQGVELVDIRRPPEAKDLHLFSGKGRSVDVPVIAVLGTDCASGKRTTAVEINRELNRRGIRSVLIGTGQTSVMQRLKYSIVIDALPSQFVIGEIEHAIFLAFHEVNPEIIIVEGQGAVGHEAFLSSIAILRGSCPNGIILQHVPGRKKRCDFQFLNVPSVENEIELIHSLSEAEVIAIALNSENSTREQMNKIKLEYEKNLNIPAFDILEDSSDKIIGALSERFRLGSNKESNLKDVSLAKH